jgi:hypothetical protein
MALMQLCLLSQQPASAAVQFVYTTTAIQLLFACVMLQALLLVAGGGWAGQLWGVSAASPLWGPASDFLSIRAVGAPVTVLLLVMQVRPRRVLSISARHKAAAATAATAAYEIVREWRCRQALL